MSNKFVVDSGAILTLLPREQVVLWGKERQEVDKMKFVNFGMQVGGQGYLMKVKVLDNLRNNLLGYDFLSGYCCQIDLDHKAPNMKIGAKRTH